MVYFPTSPKAIIEHLETPRTKSIDPYMGLSSKYIALLERVSALYRWSTTIEEERSTLFAELADM